LDVPDLKEHWETVYRTKTPSEVSWTQDVPATSLRLIHECALPKSASIIDVGGGDSHLVDHLLREGHTDLTVLDISGAALERAKKRLGEAASRVAWIVSDINSFIPERSYDLWHDRATFHFLTEPEQISRYCEIVRSAVTTYLIVATFSEQGPPKCSGLPTSHYTRESLSAQFADSFRCTESLYEDHTTPFGTTQNFVWCAFTRKDTSA
jgi:hypothetical protein